MPLAIYTNDPSFVLYPDTVLSDLVRCTDNDAGLGVRSTDAIAAYLSYSRTRSSFGAERIDDIVNSSFTEIVVIAGVDSSVTISGSPITNYAGITFPPAASGEVLVIYDTEMCNGNGYYVYDNSGSQIDFPRHILLFHELAHAFQFATFGASTEFDAETDENSLRFEDGLPFRNPNDHNGGCRGGGGGGYVGDCFIATAAQAHFRENDFDRLKWIRDSVLRRAPLGNEWFDALFTEYDQYSARISFAMTKDAGLRRSIYQMVVGPLLHFYDIVRDWIVWRMQADSAKPNHPKWQKFIVDLRGDQYDGSGYQKFSSLLQMVMDDRKINPVNKADLSLHATVYLKTVLLSTNRILPMTKWAILEPLIEIWDLVGDEDNGTEIDQKLNAFLDGWLTRVPMSPERKADVQDQIDAWVLSLSNNDH